MEKIGVLIARQRLVEKGVARQPGNAKENYGRDRENGEGDEDDALADEYQSSAREHFNSLWAKDVLVGQKTEEGARNSTGALQLTYELVRVDLDPVPGVIDEVVGAGSNDVRLDEKSAD